MGGHGIARHSVAVCIPMGVPVEQRRNGSAMPCHGQVLRLQHEPIEHERSILVPENTQVASPRMTCYRLVPTVMSPQARAVLTPFDPRISPSRPCSVRTARSGPRGRGRRLCNQAQPKARVWRGIRERRGPHTQAVRKLHSDRDCPPFRVSLCNQTAIPSATAPAPGRSLPRKRTKMPWWAHRRLRPWPTPEHHSQNPPSPLASAATRLPSQPLVSPLEIAPSPGYSFRLPR